MAAAKERQTDTEKKMATGKEVEKRSSAPKRILFLHPDLGIGGAERLVVDAAVGLQDRGHSVTVYTSHCDPRHCFDEARDGTLTVRVAGNSVFPSHVLGRLSILCAILRQLHLTLHLALRTTELRQCDYIFVDQLSACIPLLRLLLTPRQKILFYCHFPDFLLTPPRRSLLVSLYRLPFDYLESATTAAADALVVNSAFTQSVFAASFPRITTTPSIVYPCVDTTPPTPPSPSRPLDSVLSTTAFLTDPNTRLLLSINRFERKKNIALALRSFALLPPTTRATTRLIIAGGYDPRVPENVSYHADLVALCEALQLPCATSRNFISSLSVPPSTSVLFLLSIPASLKTHLLRAAALLLYTPSNEHFGIVPLEAMLAGVPVLAVDSGGPLETVRDGVTGWLRPAREDQWARVMETALGMGVGEREEMGRRGRERVVREFSKERLAGRLEEEWEGCAKRGGGVEWMWGLAVAVGVVGVSVGVGVCML